MPKRVQWEPDYSVGNAILDEQHRNLLAQCNALADCLADTGPDGGAKFQQIFGELMARAREHFATEEAQLGSGHPLLDEQQNERDEFEYLAAEIVTPENFDREELQRFLALWWTGHILGCVQRRRGSS